MEGCCRGLYLVEEDGQMVCRKCGTVRGLVLHSETSYSTSGEPLSKTVLAARMELSSAQIDAVTCLKRLCGHLSLGLDLRDQIIAREHDINIPIEDLANHIDKPREDMKSGLSRLTKSMLDYKYTRQPKEGDTLQPFLDEQIKRIVAEDNRQILAQRTRNLVHWLSSQSEHSMPVQYRVASALYVVVDNENQRQKFKLPITKFAKQLGLSDRWVQRGVREIKTLLVSVCNGRLPFPITEENVIKNLLFILIHKDTLEKLPAEPELLVEIPKHVSRRKRAATASIPSSVVDMGAGASTESLVRRAQEMYDGVDIDESEYIRSKTEESLLDRLNQENNTYDDPLSTASSSDRKSKRAKKPERPPKWNRPPEDVLKPSFSDVALNPSSAGKAELA